MLKAILESVDELSEDLRSHYKEQTTGALAGKFLLDVEASGNLELRDIGALKTALERERNALRQAQANLRNFDDLDPTEAREALKKVADMQNWDPEKKVAEGVKAQTEQLLVKHKEEIVKKDEQIAGLTKQFEEVLIINAATKAIADQKGNVELLLPHVIRQTAMRQGDNGKFIVEVLGADGAARVGDAQGNPMNIPQLIEEMKGKDVYAPAFAGSGASGSGAGPGAGGAGGGGAGGGDQKVRTISSSDQTAIDDSIEDIAAGKAVVVDD